MTHLDLLYRSFDHELSGKEQKILQDALAASSELAAEKARIEAVRNMVAQAPGQKFKPFFSARVMRGIAEMENRGEDFLANLVASFRLIFVAGAAAVVMLVAANAFSGKSLSLDSLLGLPQASLEETWELGDFVLEETK